MKVSPGKKAVIEQNFDWKTGHREEVKRTCVPEKRTYRQMLTYFLKYIDPTEGNGSFVGFFDLLSSTVLM